MIVNNSTSSEIGRLLPIYVVIFIGFVGYSLMITIFTPMIMYAHNGMISPDSPIGHRTIALGILLTAYPLGQFFGSPILGALSDRFGRKPTLLVSLSLTTSFYVLIATSLLTQCLTLLIVSSLLAGLSEANVVIAQSAVADVTTSENRSRLFGYIYLSASLAYVIGPLFGGKLADPSILHWFNYSTPFWVVFILLIITIIWTLKKFHETRPEELRRRVSYFEAFTNLLGVFTDHRIRTIYLVNFLLYLAIFGFFRSYPMYLVDEFKLDVSKVSEFIAWVGVPIVFANLWLTGFLAGRFSQRTITISSAFLTGFFMLIIIILSSEKSLWITLFLTALALAICLPSCASMLSILVSGDEQGRVMGNNQSLQVGAEALSGIGAGLLASLLIKLPLIVLAIVAILSALILILFGRAQESG